ncbi:MAG: cysteine desulfurase [Rhodobacteraceae bacterium]|nr:cysteine desulfurase [Paracoccaceae bacterium]
MYDVNKIREEFPILSREVHGKPLIYLDNGASAQKPQCVIDAINLTYSNEYSNVHRGLHFLSNLATEKYETVREKIRSFLGAEFQDEILLNSGTTEGINTISYGWAAPRLKAGDEIILSVMEHHANIVPWHFLRERQGVDLKWAEPNKAGELNPDDILNLITPKTKLIAITHMSNVLGTVVDVKKICEAVKNDDIAVLVDGSQSAVHLPIDVKDLGCDFFAITGHKLYGPSGSGAIYIKRERLNEMQPFMGGGDMIKEVQKDFVSYNVSPHKFEAGTPSIVEAIGLGVAIDYLTSIGMQNIYAHEVDLKNYAEEKLNKLEWLDIQGNAQNKGAIFSFTMDGNAHAHDISTIVDRRGIAVRAGHHCAQPLMNFLGVSATCRASFGMYNTKNEIDELTSALEFANELFG